MNEFGNAGKQLFESVTAKFELDADEIKVLTMAARSSDDLAELEAARVGVAVMVPGSMGQERVNPLFAEIRATRALVSQLLGRLKLPEDPAAKGESDFNSNRARKAAGARWNH
jgi:hypothetical protein